LRDLPELPQLEVEADILVAPSISRHSAGLHDRKDSPIAGEGHPFLYLGRDDTQDMWLKLNAATEIAFGPFQSLRAADASDLLIRREKVGFLYRLPSDDGFWTLPLSS
jgi:hypothetical protein